MQAFFFTLFFATMVFACGQSGGSKATEKTKEVQSAIRPGTIATTTTGYSMRAKIRGKEWTASSMVSPEAAGRIVGYYGKEYIGLPFAKSDLKAGNKITLDEGNAPDLNLNDGCLWQKPTGEIEITKADETAAEGRFSFAAICNGKPLVVSEGFFRIMFLKQ